MKDSETKWLTDVSEIPTANEASLKRSLITCDGRGEKLKEAALEELLRRAREEGSRRSFSSVG